MSIFEKLRELGINENKTGHYTCPKCSQDRKKKNDKCFDLKFDNAGVVWKCHHCDWKGGFKERGLEPATKQYTRPTKPKTKDDNTKVYEWMLKRGIKKETAEKFKVGYNGKEIVMPVYRNGELINVRYRTHDKKFRQEKNSEPVFYGIDVADSFDDKSKIAITEGEFDCMCITQLGTPAVSVPSGAQIGKMEYIDNCYDWIDGFSQIIIAVDSDTKGKALKDELVRRLGAERCVIVEFEKYDCKDANDALLNNRLEQAIEEAEEAKIDRILRYSDVWYQIENLYHGITDEAYSTGWYNLDPVIKIKTKRLMVVTGYPSRGKSFFVDNMLLNLTNKYKWKHALFSFEISTANHFARVASMNTGKQFLGKNLNDKMSLEELYSQHYLKEYFYHNDDKTWSIEEILERAKSLIRHKGVKTITIDPYNRLMRDIGKREDLFVADMLSELSSFAKQHDVLMIMIAHPAKPMTEKDGSTRVPDMYSISGGANWYNIADYGLIVHRERNEIGKLKDGIDLHIAKIKDFDLGDPSGGVKHLDFIDQKLTEPRII